MESLDAEANRNAVQLWEADLDRRGAAFIEPKETVMERLRGSLLKPQWVHARHTPDSTR